MADPAPEIINTQLANGLTVLLWPTQQAPVTSFWLWYRVGSRDEPTGHTGSSHWVEHMQFKGTPRFPAGTLEQAIPRHGGVWNAFTSSDFTAYYETLPTAYVDLALEMEADRMANTGFNPEEVDSERTVIIAERQGRENSPFFLLDEEIRAAAFRVHPYHHSVIGDHADLTTMTRDDLYQHYRTYYVPNNATLVAVGSFNPTDLLAQIENHFGPIPAGEIPPRLTRPEPPQLGERRVQIERESGGDHIVQAYKVPAASHPDLFPLLALDSILAGASSLNMFAGGGLSNRTSRIYRRLVLTELAAGVGGGLSTSLDPTLYTLSAVARQGVELSEIEAAMDEEVARLRDEPIQQAELDRALKQARALFAYGAESVSNKAFWLGFSALLGDPLWFHHYLTRLAAVTVEDVQRVAQNYFVPNNRVVGWYRHRPNTPNGATE